MITQTVAERIKALRLQMLVHSFIYYKMNQNIISDNDFDKRAKELYELQQKYPSIAEDVVFADEFESWTGSSGAFLKMDFSWLPGLVNSLLNNKQVIAPVVVKKQKVKKCGVKKLF